VYSRRLPLHARANAQDLYMTFTEHYEMVCSANAHRDGSAMVDPFGDQRGKFNYAKVLERMRTLEAELRAEGYGDGGGGAGGGEAGGGAA
jgi:hypothetical protein